MNEQPDEPFSSPGEEKQTIQLEDMPIDAVIQITNRMNNHTKLAFFLSSNICANLMPNDFITQISAVVDEQQIIVRTKQDQNYKLHFSDFCKVTCFDHNGRKLWKSDESRQFGSFVEVFSAYFRKITMNSTKLKMIHILPSQSNEKRIFFNISHCKNLRDLKILNWDDGIPVEVLYKVTESMKVKYAPLTICNLQKLKARDMYIMGLKISSEDANEYLKLFVNAKLDENIQRMVINTKLGFEKDIVMENLNVLGITEKCGEREFALVSRSNNTIRVVIVTLGKRWLELYFLSQRDFCRSKFYYKKYGKLVQECIYRM